MKYVQTTKLFRNSASWAEALHNGLHAEFIVVWKSLMSVDHTSYLSNRWLSRGSLGGAEVGVLVGSRGSRCPLVCVAQRCEVTAVLNTGAPLKLLTHTVAIKDITLTRFTLGDREENERGGFMKEYKAWFLNLAGYTLIPHCYTLIQVYLSANQIRANLFCIFVGQF